jgi:thiol-disulfide isomerase/thioredoxin
MIMRRIFALLITIVIVACSTNTNTFNLDGIAEGFDDNTQILVYTVENNQPVIIDTLTVLNGKFSATYPKSENHNVHYLNLAQQKTNVLYFPENEDLKVTLYKDSIQASYVTGGSQNEAYTEFSKKLRSFNAKKQSNMERFKIARNQQDGMLVTQIQNENKILLAEESAFKKEYISANNNSLFAVMLLSEMVSRKEILPNEASQMIANLSPKIAASQTAADLKKTIAGLMKSEVGGLAPPFSAPTPEGEMLSLQETLGKYTIIDFWASWCRPCRMENPNVVNVYNKYHDKGLNIISVSLDKAGQKDRWIKAIKDDKMDWYHVSNLKFWQDPIAKTYGVRSIPATFLLDEEGRIIGKNLRGAALETKIASLFGQ